MEEQQEIEAVEMKKYVVRANKSMYVAESYDTVEEAVQAVSRLVNDGYAMVTIRDDGDEEDIW